jgi:hypothetical protein
MDFLGRPISVFLLGQSYGSLRRQTALLGRLQNAFFGPSEDAKGLERQVLDVQSEDQAFYL